MNIPIHVNKYNSKDEFLEFLNTKNNFIKIYTDASKTSERTAFAFFDQIYNYGVVYRCNDYLSVFSAEMLAILHALQYVLKNFSNYTQSYFLILCDSMSVVNALCNKNINLSPHYTIYKIRSLVYELSIKNLFIEFCWVPSHSGILGNELVDKLAKSSYSVICNCPVSYTDLNDYIKDLMIKRWELSLAHTRQVKGKWLAEITPKPSTSSWFEKSTKFLDRQLITAICRLRIGHCKIPSHLYRLKLTDNESCIYCNYEICDLQHLFFDCKQFSVQRLLLICQCQDLLGKCDLPKNIFDLLKFPLLYNSIFQFIQSTVGSI
ncbi:hypothetical protein PYW07_006799 [Mythimna separata]|uniref:ribonuclease H n=1 Tax=Mythimna separata TaxID=271217 RepID=A0AAD7Y6D8_MYTSE|nr:hypothetical protein PYW07_013439 [Mythimna separata]KAJ8714437.1 hypothetical protein PYW07_002662 [Mythimna separata]KAJ8723783.1 hypothetical protein PYW07_007763 [Mythimna separata]KAJ8730034.1 hypothetical protein PYW07_017072 [Mythimna separata]KAJ8735179.1 hypothetical protein PYW07_006799 [Mythimna separata]